MEGIPLHAWSESTFRCLKGSLGQLVEVDEDAILKRRVDVCFVCRCFEICMSAYRNQ